MVQSPNDLNTSAVSAPDLADFFEMPIANRQETLLAAIFETHQWHYPRNRAYRRAVGAKGVGEKIVESQLSRILRPTAHVFKSYIDILETPFPEYHPRDFLSWLGDHLSIQIPPDRILGFKKRYPNLEVFLQAIERNFNDLGFVIGTSSGTSGKSTIMVRDALGVELAIKAYQLAVYRLWGTKDAHEIIFIMPEQTRIVMAWLARLATQHLGMGPQTHFGIPFPASPDHVRIRSGQLFKPGWRGLVEKRVLYPFMNKMNDSRVKETYVNQTIEWLEDLSKTGKAILLFGGWVQLDAMYEGLYQRGYGKNGKVLKLNPESMIGTGGGVKEFYPFSPMQIRERLSTVLHTFEGQAVAHRDVYGMAEANWAAAQCAYGNYHLPPWVFAIVLDENDEIVPNSEASGLLAFFDPLAGGRLFPNFFKTADQVKLVNGGKWYDPDLECRCGYQTTYITENSIVRQDRLEEAGCAAQL
jgi:hypothetical protein